MSNAAPITIGQMADSYYEARASRLAKAKELDELKGLEAVAEQMLMQALRAQGLEGAKGNVCNAAIKRTTEVAVLRDDDGTPIGKDDFIEFMLDTRDASLLQFRPSLTRCKELWGDGIEIPGVKAIEVESLSLTKVKGR
jgi:hypothetical protein